MRALILSCYRGESTFDEFVAGTMPYWQKAAADLMTRWDHPPAVEEDDLVQEMLLGAWKALQTVDPFLGDPRRYVVFGAVKAARRWFHRQRGAYGFARTSGKNRSPEGRYPVAADWLDRVGQEPERSPQDEATAVLEAMRLAQTENDRRVLDALWRSTCTDDVAAELCRQPGGSRRRKPGKRELKEARAEALDSMDRMAARARALAVAANC